jgi:hypothetical protein
MIRTKTGQNGGMLFCIFMAFCCVRCSVNMSLSDSESEMGFVDETLWPAISQINGRTLEGGKLVFLCSCDGLGIPSNRKGIVYQALRDYVARGGGLILLEDSAMLLIEAFGMSEISCLRFQTSAAFELGGSLMARQENTIEINLLNANGNSRLTPSNLSKKLSLSPYAGSTSELVLANSLFHYSGSDFILIAAANFGKGRIAAISSMKETCAISGSAGLPPCAWADTTRVQKSLVDKAAAWIEEKDSLLTGIKATSYRLSKAGAVLWSWIALVVYLGLVSVYFLRKYRKK